MNAAGKVEEFRALRACIETPLPCIRRHEEWQPDHILPRPHPLPERPADTQAITRQLPRFNERLTP